MMPTPCSTSCSPPQNKPRAVRSDMALDEGGGAGRSRAGGGGGSIVRAFGGKQPVIAKSVFLAENCAVIGDVEIGEDSSIWYSVTVRGDVMPIRIGARTSVQDGT